MKELSWWLVASSQFPNFCFFLFLTKMFLPAVYIKAETSRKEKSIKNIATNFQEHLKQKMGSEMFVDCANTLAEDQLSIYLTSC